jgi:hypothetical protein
LKILFVLITLFVSSSVYGFEQEKTIKKDVTYDGVPERVIYKVWGESWEAPDWSFEIFDGDELIYHEHSYPAYWKMTKERGDFDSCSVIAECMEKAFRVERITSWFYEVNAEKHNSVFMLENFAANAPDWYQTIPGVTESKAKENTKRLYQFLKGKKIICINPSGEGGFGGLVTYDRFLKAFVTFYTP